MIAAGLTLRQLALFWRKVDKNGPVTRADLGPCWVWTGAVLKNGYGEVSISRRTKLVHRLAYTIAYGPPPPRHDVDHRCWTRRCVRPSHLRAATRKQNNENQTPAVRPGRVRGVSWDASRGKWAAKVGHNGRTVNLGRYDTQEEAAAVAASGRMALYTHNDSDLIGAGT